MKTFGSNDTIFARATMLGYELINIRLNGISSKEALMTKVREELGSYIGLINLNVRNMTQGWAHSQYIHVA